jgi:glyoxylase-like metal-dependent hydrolase (beta-lactamase superfamily II)/rhodanese-related sulfurtransferase
MLFRQLIDAETSSYSYLLADPATRDAVLIDPVREQLERDLEVLRELDLTLRLAVETHVHADHVTASGLLRERLGCKTGIGERAGVLTADLRLRDGEVVHFGGCQLEVRATPGHTEGCVSYVCHRERIAFTGDALLIRGCGRTDFQGGDAGALFASVRERIFTLPDDTRLYPAHDYRGRTVSTVGEEKRCNPRVGLARSREEFVGLMQRLELAYPKRMDEAVPANLASGLTEPEPACPSTDPRDRWAPVLRTPSGVAVLEPGWVEPELARLRIVDVREPVEFCGRLGHLPGAELVPLAALTERAAAWKRDEPLLVVCTYGTRSGKAAQLLERQGFERVASLHGGLRRWTDEKRVRVEVLGDRAPQDAALFQGMDI